MELMVYGILTTSFLLIAMKLWRIFRMKKHRKYWFLISLLAENYVFFFLLLLAVERTNTLGATAFYHDCFLRYGMSFMYYVIACNLVIPGLVLVFLVSDFVCNRKQAR